MGLDYVEMIMDVEEKYGIKIPDKEAGALRTVGDLHGLLCAKLLAISRAAGKCPCMDVFQRLRRALMKETGIDRGQIRLDTPVEILLPLENRLQHWIPASIIAGLTLPLLRTKPDRAVKDHFAWVFLFGAAICFFAIAFSFITLLALHSIVAGGILILSSIIFVQCWRLDERKEADYTLLPEGCVTFRDLVRQTLELNKMRYETEPSPYSQEGIWNDIANILVDNFRCDPKSITPGARLYEDLNLG